MAAFFEVLRSEGVDRIFAHPGSEELPLLAGLAKNRDFEYVLAPHEHSAVAMADGYARATGRTAFVSLHVSAGVATGLVNARRSRTPLVVTTGQRDPLASPASKYATEVHHARDLAATLRRAFAAAARPPSGPVLVSVPAAVLDEDTDVVVPERSPLAPLGAATGLDQAAWLLTAADRPVVVAGDGVGRDNAVSQLVSIAERLNAPVYHQPLSDRVNFPFTHPLHVGMLPPENADARKALAEHDVVLFVGSHAFTPDGDDPAVPEGTRVVQLDDDADELGRAFPVALGLAGGIRASLQELTAQIGGRAKPMRRARQASFATADPEPVPLDPRVAARAIADGLGRDAIVVEEAGSVGMLLRPLLRLDTPGSFVHAAGGGPGWGVSAAVGTSMGCPDRSVVAVLGDGSALVGLQGLLSAARYWTPVLFLVMNNGEYRTLKDTLGRTRPELDLGPLDWTAAGAFAGIEARRVATSAELREVVAAAGTLTAPLLVDVAITGMG